jgi:glycosyltransferase involved in cell wall biosynthesis
MKLIVQIPCYNEEMTLPQTVHDIPRKIEGIEEVEILIIDDGSKDRTVQIAKDIGVDHIVKNTCNKGLAQTFHVGLDACLHLGADIIVNTDGDNQYKGHDIPKLITPILKDEADIVIGDRQTDKIPYFSSSKKKMQKIGSRVVRILSETNVPDAVSGFRAFSREAAMQLNIVSYFSYTIETIIQAGKKNLAIANVPIGTNPKTRESRLFKSIPKFLLYSLTTMIRTYAMYKPLRVFFYIGCLFVIGGLIPSIRFLFYYFTGHGGGHIQSLILSAILFIIGFQVFLIGLVADIISCNRKLLEETLLRIKRIELDQLNVSKEKIRS